MYTQGAVVVILAGGYATGLSSELSTLDAAALSGPQATVKGLKATTLGKYAGQSRITPALVTINDQPSLVHVLRAIQRVKRVESLAGCWIVYNECDKDYFVGPEGLFDEPYASKYRGPGPCAEDTGTKVPQLL